MSPSYPGWPAGQSWALSPGYDPQVGYRVYTGKALEIARDERA